MNIVTSKYKIQTCFFKKRWIQQVNQGVHLSGFFAIDEFELGPSPY